MYVLISKMSFIQSSFHDQRFFFYLKLDVNIKESSMSNVLFDFHFSQNFLLLIGYQQVQFYFQ